MRRHLHPPAPLRRALPALIALAGCPYEAPLNPYAEEVLNTIDGEVVFAGQGEPGPTYVLLYDAQDPPPPDGTGAPATFAAIAPRAFTGAGAGGLQAADYALTRITDGSWLLAGLMDTDGDFNPFSSALAGATCGDWGGAYLADLAGTPAAVEVSGGKALHDVTVLVGRPYTLERPVFSLAGDLVLSRSELAGPIPPRLRLRTAAVSTTFDGGMALGLGPACTSAEPVCSADLPLCGCEPQSVQPCGTALWTELRDADADGVVDPYPGEPQASRGLLDVWPRVYLEYTGELDTFEHEGKPLPERWVSEAYPLAVEITVAALTAQLPPGEAAAALGPVGAPFPLYELSVTASPVFVHYHEGGLAGVDQNGPFDLVDLTSAPSDAVPTGAWSVTLVSSSGQTWTLPNDVGLIGSPSPDPTIDNALQAAALLLDP